jgi:methyl-accepting chemotaxis protein
LGHNDDAFKDRHDQGSDATGRFLPYWTKDANGKGLVQPPVEYNSYELASYGLKKGAWYA